MDEVPLSACTPVLVSQSNQRTISGDGNTIESDEPKQESTYSITEQWTQEERKRKHTP